MEEVYSELIIVKEPEDEVIEALYSIWVKKEDSIGSSYPLCYHLPLKEAIKSILNYLKDL